MLSSLLREAEERVDASEKSLELRVTEMTEQYDAAARDLLRESNESVQKAYEEETRLEGDLKALNSAMNRFEASAVRYLQHVDRFVDEVKELGDLDNWVACIEKDVREGCRIFSLLESRQREVSLKGRGDVDEGK
mmetsp:Transcript_1338/g.2789  ORF Transcript_1338/g.2789 Transcript_1338/m.2789 type:complete len:135 (-) Transcript_1338:305-709(-)|eukprot:CAMPEP_0184683572 /NCGR_PEP_ID=MMETSP0312-20130426/11845_1 /TAXON_ID=31354 /ORGANISM="Compsopogon coeruleus, Strain SAG 36.94" /LENGTH=134 /DNA_ID=CAMNT_0027136021 /DNA_START=12 /DNA_END=416 /DNA_ORIENTATION=-